MIRAKRTKRARLSQADTVSVNLLPNGWKHIASTTTIPKRTKVAIVGFAESKHLAPWTDPAFEFWTLNMTQKDLEHVAGSRWFELHQRKYLEAHPLWRDNFRWHVTTFRQWKHTPLYVWDKADWPDCPTAVTYPKKAIELDFPRGAYHQGSFDWILALAIYERFQEIHLYGWDASRGGEPLAARACLEYWVGIAEGRGIKVYTPDVGDLFATYQLVRSHKQYGYHDAQLVEGIYDPVPGVPT